MMTGRICVPCMVWVSYKPFIISWKGQLFLPDQNSTVSGFICWTYGCSHLTMILYLVWKCPHTSLIETHLSSSDGVTECPVRAQHPSYSDRLEIWMNPFQKPQQTKQQKLESSLFTDVNPACWICGHDLLFRIWEITFCMLRLTLFSLTWTVKRPVSFCHVNELWSLIKVAFIVKGFT